MMFPKRGAVYEDYLDLRDLAPEEVRAWQAALRRFFQRITYRDPRRIVVKSPPHTARVRVLLEMFPDAKFVHLVRDPFDLYASTVNLWKSLNEVQRLQSLGDETWLEEYVLSSLERMYAAFESDRQLLSDNQLVDLRYEELVNDPVGQLRQVYGQLELGDFARVEPAVTRHLAEVKNYRTNRFVLDEATCDRVRQRWAGYFERYGYATQAAGQTES
jgi:hypothetical protein